MDRILLARLPSSHTYGTTKAVLPDYPPAPIERASAKPPGRVFATTGYELLR